MNHPENKAPEAAEYPLNGHITVDGIEGRVARVELPDGTTEEWSLASLPRGVKEGDVVRLHVHDGDLDAEVDHAETRKRREKAQATLDALNTPAPAGEITL